MNKEHIIDLDDETLEFDDIPEISPDEEIPEIKMPTLDDFLNLKPIIETPLWTTIDDTYDFIGFKIFSWLLLREVACLKKIETQNLVRKMIPHIARFQQYHFWEENEWGQRIRNPHNVIKNRNIQRHWV